MLLFRGFLSGALVGALSSAAWADDSKEFAAIDLSPTDFVSQNDPKLMDWFDSQGYSSLCFPAALAQNMLYLTKRFQPQGEVSPDWSKRFGDPKTMNGIAWVRSISESCGFIPDWGEEPVPGLKCALRVLKLTGYSGGSSRLIAPNEGARNGTLPIEKRTISPTDITDSLRRNLPTIVLVGWYTYSEESKSWLRDGGHYVGVYGIDSNSADPISETLNLKIVNPDESYTADSHFDLIRMERLAVKDGVSYPATGPYIFRGRGFYDDTYAFVEEIIQVSPSEASMPSLKLEASMPTFKPETNPRSP